MSIKSFLMKSALRAKGVDKEQAEAIAAEIEKNPEVMSALKSLEDNKEVKELFEKMQKVRVLFLIFCDLFFWLLQVKLSNRLNLFVLEMKFRKHELTAYFFHHLSNKRRQFSII